MNDLVNKILLLNKQLETSVKMLRKTSQDYARAYTQYRIALAEELVKLKDNGTPATLCSDLARGKREVADKKFNEIATEGIYRANLESINALKIQIRTLEEQVKREYGAGLDE